MEEQKYFTPQEIAEKFKVKKSTVYFWIREGKLRAVRLGSLIRIPEYALKDFIKDTSKE
ncbi:MAG: helix-turn-helix domain-containing protein [Syntrophomonadaceae bacterium]|nr:helix-turn-helix domain-containing protein [Syntrophomonadaceae bacterium]